VSCLRSCRKILSPLFGFSITKKKQMKPVVMTSAAIVLILPCLAQAQTLPPAAPASPPAGIKSTITIPAGTRIALVLTQPIQSRHVRRGDDVFAQVVSPVDAGNEVVIPAGTFVQGSIDRLGRKSAQGEVHMNSLAITFPDGYMTPIAGPITLHSDEGYAIKDPGGKRAAWALAVPAAGAGIGALIGHAAGSSQSTLTTTLPPGCTGPPPFCLTSSMTVPGSAGRDTAIGAVTGGAIGGVAAMALLFSSHQFYLVAGAPIQMTLLQPVTLQQDEVSKAVRDSQQHPVPVQPIAPLPVYIPYPGIDNGVPPPVPATPPTVIPGAPGPNGVPGPPIIIPGTPGN